ncbi:hypothetical protein KAW18_02030 [candidate division WOR-3 bacterium]|nr:hypothetical protein [candidate division WOR-3 bacterium]
METMIFEGKPYAILHGVPDTVRNQQLEKISWSEYVYSKTLFHIIG